MLQSVQVVIRVGLSKGMVRARPTPQTLVAARMDRQPRDQVARLAPKFVKVAIKVGLSMELLVRPTHVTAPMEPRPQDWNAIPITPQSV
jgi:hypothetical protein